MTSTAPDCAEGFVLAEDLTCVPTDFYAEETTPVVQVPSAPVPETLPATGINDVSPAILVLGIALVVAGVVTKLRAKHT